jgi:hypothetical protein
MEITVEAQNFLEGTYNYGGSTATIRVYSTKSFITSDNEIVSFGEVGSQGFFKSIPCTIVDGTLHCPSFTLPSTDDGLDDQTARFIFVLFDYKNNKREILFANLYVPSNLGPSLTFAEIVLANKRTVPWRDTSVYTKTEINNLLSFALNDASDLVKGRMRLSVAPVLATDPVVPGYNDPTWAGLNQSPALWAQVKATNNPKITIPAAETSEQYDPGPIRLPNGDIWVYVKGALRIYAWKSTDNGATFTIQNGGVAVLVPGTGEAYAVVEPAVVYDAATNTIRMWYKGINTSGGVPHISYATASGSAPTVFTKQGTILTAATVSTAFESGATLTDLSINDVIRIGGQYYFYGTYGVAAGLRIFVARGTSWNNPVPLAVCLSEGLKFNVQKPTVFRLPNSSLYYMIFSEGGQQNIPTQSPLKYMRVATSLDGITWERADESIMLIPTHDLSGTGTQWESAQVFTPAILKKNTSNYDEPVVIDNRIQLYYSGVNLDYVARVGILYLYPQAARQSSPAIIMSGETTDMPKVWLTSTSGGINGATISTISDAGGVGWFIGSNMKINHDQTLVAQDADLAGDGIYIDRDGTIAFYQMIAGVATQNGFLRDGVLTWNGDVKITDATKGLILKDAADALFKRITLNAGALVITPV